MCIGMSTIIVAPPRSFRRPSPFAQVYLAQGDPERAVQTLVNQNSKAAINRFWLSASYAAHGDTDKALHMLNKAFAAGYRDLAGLDASPYFSNLHSDPRYRQLIQTYRK